MCWGRISKWPETLHCSHYIKLQYGNVPQRVLCKLFTHNLRLRLSLTVIIHLCTTHSQPAHCLLAWTQTSKSDTLSFSLFFLFSVTQMLTTQADRFSPEEVNCGPFTLIVIIMANCVVRVGESEKAQRDKRHHDNHLHPRQTLFHTKSPSMNPFQTFFCMLGYCFCEGQKLW